MIGRLSLRARLAAAFAAALLVVLALAGLFVYLRVSDSLTETIDDGLGTRAAELQSRLQAGELSSAFLKRTVIDAEDSFAEVLAADGRPLASTLPPAAAATLTADELEAARRQPALLDEREVEGIDSQARILAEPASAGERPVVLVVGASTGDRDEALSGIAGAFLVGAPLAVLLAAGLGYLLATRSLAPVEAMRRRAEEINLEHSGERLPLSSARDEIHRLGETLNAMLDRIERSLERERVFVADASHELRTPLAVLRAELELAGAPARSPEELRTAVGAAAVEVERLSRLAEDLLVIARSDGGRLPIKRETVAVATLLERVRWRHASQADAAGRPIVVAADPELRAELDPLRIEQALGNLIGNALEHGGGGEIRVEGMAEAEELVLAVGDEGPGFPEGFEGKAFERFSRADPGRTGGGAGLGLAIVSAVAAAHGGGAEIVREGPGALVRMRIPLST